MLTASDLPFSSVTENNKSKECDKAVLVYYEILTRHLP